MWAAGSVVHMEHRQGFGKLVIFYSRATKTRRKWAQKVCFSQVYEHNVEVIGRYRASIFHNIGLLAS